MEQYLESSEFIDYAHPDVMAKASQLKGELSSDVDIAKACFNYVRDEIKHSWDFKIDQITCKASDVLAFQTGYCYAQSHLLAALLRANGIPAGLCYQRLSVEGNGAPFCLHGLNAVHLEDFGWYRIDPRGNKEGVDAQFNPPIEQLAFNTDDRFETDIQGIFPEPLAVVINVLQTYDTYLDTYNNLPDIEVYT